MRAHRISVVPALIAACFALSPLTAHAALGDKLTLRAAASLGGPVGLIGDDSPYWKPTTAPFTLRLAGQLSAPAYTPLTLEINAVIPCGFGVNLLFDVFRSDRLRVHLLDLGVFWNAFKPVSVQRLHRQFDLTAGLGVDVRVWRTLSVSADWRVFLPNPMTTLPDYADFALPMYREALKGGQLWIGAAYAW